MNAGSESVYLDFNATTPLASEVLEAMLPFLQERFGNPSSIHGFGRPAKKAVLGARETLAELLRATPREIVFTGGGTEADNLGILGALGALESEGGQKRHLVTSATEHHAVLHVMERLGSMGYDVTFLPVDSGGRVSPASLEKALRPDTALVSIMLANNETGVLQPVRELAEIAHAGGALMHTDGVQACGKIGVDVGALGVDLLALSGHKFYGPKGMGALYVRSGVPFKSVFRGGGQERARRPGTENVAGIVGLAEALRLSMEHLPAESKRLAQLRDSLQEEVLRDIEGSHVNGAGSERTPNTVNFRFDGVDGESLLKRLDEAGYAVSTGAACSAGAVQPSHVLLAMGLSPEEVQGSIRVSLGRYTTPEHTAGFFRALDAAVSGARRGVPERSGVS